VVVRRGTAAAAAATPTPAQDPRTRASATTTRRRHGRAHLLPAPGGAERSRAAVSAWGPCRMRKWAPCSTSGPSDCRAEESNDLKGKVKVDRQLVGLPWAADCCPCVEKLRTVLPCAGVGTINASVWMVWATTTCTGIIRDAYEPCFADLSSPWARARVSCGCVVVRQSPRAS
jgi:hypothetical protein